MPLSGPRHSGLWHWRGSRLIIEVLDVLVQVNGRGACSLNELSGTVQLPRLSLILDCGKQRLKCLICSVVCRRRA